MSDTADRATSKNLSSLRALWPFLRPYRGLMVAALLALNLTAAKAAPLTAFIASYSSPEGLFFAKLSAASTMAIAPILILGWFSQKQLVRGLTFGAVK